MAPIKSPPLVFSLFSKENLLAPFIKDSCYEEGVLFHQYFADGESYLRFDTSVKNRKIIFIDSLDHPNTKILPLIFAAQTAKELGALEIGLVAPYLSYMRQDKRFQEGESVTSRSFAALISENFDWLVTIDPHLHRYKSLDEIYKIPSHVLGASPILSTWIQQNIDSPLLIGPDAESQQWVAQIAARINAPYTILEKQRTDDRHVTVSIPDLSLYQEHTPVLVDDILSTGHTLLETIGHLKRLRAKPPVCVIVHPIFAGITVDELLKAGATQIASCNTIKHISNKLDIIPLLIEECYFVSFPNAQF